MIGSEIPMKPSGGLSREERWEMRRKQKLGMQPELKPAPPPAFPAPNPPFESKPAANFAPFPAKPFEPAFASPEPPRAAFPTGPQNPSEFPDVRQSFPSPSYPQDRSAKLPQAAPSPPFQPAEVPRAAPADSFFTNPISDQEQRRRQAQMEYRQQAQESMVPRAPRRMTPPDESAYVPANRGERVSRSQIPMTNLTEQRRAESDQKSQYRQELLRQMKEKEEQKKRKEEPPDDGGFFKFGRPGAGAPNRDAYGNIIATRAPKYNENDPRFLNPRAQQDYAPPQSYSPNPRAYNPPAYYPEAPPYADPYASDAPRYQDPQRLPPQEAPRYPQEAPRYPQEAPRYPQEAPRYPQEAPRYPQEAPRYPQEAPRYPPQEVPRYPPQQVVEPFYPPQYDGVQPPLPPEFPPGKQLSPPRVNPVVGGDSLVGLQSDLDQASKYRQKAELARALQEQMEEKKRKQEEEKRQKLLEERLEEAKLEKQRQDMEEEYRREIEKKKKEYRDFQSANEAAVMVPKGKPRRQRTPLDFPVAEPPRSPPRDPPANFPPPVVTEVPLRSVPVDSAQQVNGQMENELWRLRNEMVNQNNELRESLAVLKQQSLQANQQRFEAVKELERVREEMKLRAHEEEVRQRELFMAISKNPTRQVYEPTTRLPAANPLPLVLPRSHPDDPLNTLGLDVADKSLTAESKFLPVVGAHVDMPPPPRKREVADASLVSLPEFGPTNVPAVTTVDAGLTAGTTLGIEAINRRNEERLLALERFEVGASGHDEISKLDALMANYLEAEKKLQKPGSGKGNGRPSSLASRGKMVVSKPALNSIPEAEADGSFSLPSLNGEGKDWKYSMNS